MMKDAGPPSAERSLHQIDTKELRQRIIHLQGRVRVHVLKSVLWAAPLAVPLVAALDWDSRMFGVIAVLVALLGIDLARGWRALRDLRAAQRLEPEGSL